MRLSLLIASVLALAACAAPDSPSTGKGHAGQGSANANASHSTASASALARRAPRPIASLADKGRLLAYTGAAPIQRSAYTWHEIALSEAHAMGATVDGGMLELTAPDGTPIKLRYDHHVEHADGNWTWIGRPDGARPGTEAIITFGPDAVFGSVPNGNKPPLRITSVKGRTFVMETNALLNATARKWKGRDVVVPPALAAARDKVTALAAAQPQQLTASGAVPESATIDMVIGYTKTFAMRLGGTSAANTRLAYLVDITNQAFTNSKIVGRVRLMKTVQVIYPDATNNETALRELTGVKCTETSNGGLDCSDAPIPAALQPLVDARETYKGDLMSLVRVFSDPENVSCGIAWLIGSGQTDILSTDAYAAVSVVSDSSGEVYDDNGYYCRDETFAHETAHNMGSAHDVVTARGDDNTLTADEYGRYPYSFGYKTPQFYTIMAYGDGAASQQGLRVYSNPRISICGQACGNTSADNARSLGQTIPVVASFYTSTVPAPLVHNDIDGNDRSDLLLQRPGNLVYWIMANTTIARSRVFNMASDMRVVGTGDLDNNGRADIILVNANREVFAWMGDGTTFTPVRIAQMASGLSVVGVGDVDRDGKDDLMLFRGGLLVHWRMNGAAIKGSSSYTVDGALAPAAISDFDGNGAVDIVMKDAAGNLYSWLFSGTAYTKTFIAKIASTLTVKGAQDIDADGNADLLLFRPGQIVQFFMNGASVVRSRSLSLSTSYSLVTTGDFNGDMLGDIMLQHNSNRSLYIWRGTATGYASSTLPTPSTGYSMVP